MLTTKKIAESTSVKYPGVVIDNKLKFDEEVKTILDGLACGIKVLNTLSNRSPEEKKYIIQCNCNKLRKLFSFSFGWVATTIFEGPKSN